MSHPGPVPAKGVPTTAPIAVELVDIAKRFPGVLANDGVNLAVRSGEVHAVVGENGAGKSTLMKIVYGMQAPDEGTIRVNGDEVRFKSPKDAIAVGIGMVHQHFMLADNLTVAENIILGAEPSKGPRLDLDAARARIRELADDYGMELDPDELVETLTVGERQRVEILKVLYRGARILILDEPTAVLVPHEVDELFESLNELKAEGVTVIFISHKLDEVLAVADAITVIRAGRTVGTVAPSDVTAETLAEMMVGSELPKPEVSGSTVTDTVELELDGVSVTTDDRPVLTDVSFRVRRGEIVGIAGVEGNGQTELVEAIMGLLPLSSGTIRLGGDDIAGWSTRERRHQGIGWIPADRHRNGLLLEAPLWENVVLGHQDDKPFSKGPWIDRAGARQRTEEIMRDFDVRAPGVDVSAGALSGGNQQKLIVGREMANGPRLLVASHPTRGIDVGAQAAVWAELREARAGGQAILLISADLEELIGLSDTLLVILRGRITGTLDPSTITPQELGSHMTGARGSAA